MYMNYIKNTIKFKCGFCSCEIVSFGLEPKSFLWPLKNLIDCFDILSNHIYQELLIKELLKFLTITAFYYWLLKLLPINSLSVDTWAISLYLICVCIFWFCLPYIESKNNLKMFSHQNCLWILVAFLVNKKICLLMI
jgi:hypothetical protein